MKPAKLRRAGAGVLLAEIRRAGAGVLLAEIRRQMLRARRAIEAMEGPYRKLRRRDDQLEREWAALDPAATTKAPDHETSFNLAHRARGGRRAR